jgi:hypothetical protein
VTRKKGFYLHLPSHRQHVTRLAAADPNFWGSSPEEAAIEQAAQQAQRQATAAKWMLWRAANPSIPEITFPQGEATDMRNGVAYRCVAVNGVEEWFPLGSARALQLAAWYQAWTAAHYEIFGGRP